MTAIVFGVLLDADAMDWPGRNQLMTAMADHTQVVLLERSRADRSRLLDMSAPRLEQVSPGLHVMRNAFATRSHRLGRRSPRLASLLDGPRFKHAMARAGMGDFLLWLTVNDPALAHGVPGSRLVYDCMDPNFLPASQRRFDQSELALGRRAAVVFASARTLHERMAAVNEATFLLPNAAPIPDRLEPPIPPRPAALAGRSGPVIGYLGTIDWRFDAEHVISAATALPAMTFVVAGRVNVDQKAKVASLRRLPNVIMPGQLSNSDGRAYMAAFDVGLVPFIPSPTNDAINPVKMFMYLAHGMPVVSTWIAECRDNPHVNAAPHPEAFVQAIQLALGQRDAGSARIRRDYASVNTWRHRADEAHGILKDRGLLR